MSSLPGTSKPVEKGTFTAPRVVYGSQPTPVLASHLRSHLAAAPARRRHDSTAQTLNPPGADLERSHSFVSVNAQPSGKYYKNPFVRIPSTRLPYQANSAFTGRPARGKHHDKVANHVTFDDIDEREVEGRVLQPTPAYRPDVPTSPGPLSPSAAYGQAGEPYQHTVPLSRPTSVQPHPYRYSQQYHFDPQGPYPRLAPPPSIAHQHPMEAPSRTATPSAYYGMGERMNSVDGGDVLSLHEPEKATYGVQYPPPPVLDEVPAQEPPAAPANVYTSTVGYGLIPDLEDEYNVIEYETPGPGNSRWKKVGSTLSLVLAVVFLPILLPIRGVSKCLRSPDAEYQHIEEVKSPNAIDRALSLVMWAPRSVYHILLLNLPPLYLSRVAKIFQDADLSLGEIKDMVMRAESDNVLREMEPETLPAAFRLMVRAWDEFIINVVREWKQLSVITVMLLTAILTILQIEDAASDPYTRYFALSSLVCALISLLYGYIYIMRFGTMRKPRKAAEWALEAKKSRSGAFWNMWVLLAMPAIFLAWSLLLFVCCIMALLWRTGFVPPESPESLVARSVAPSTGSWALHTVLRSIVSGILLFGLLYGVLIVQTFDSWGRKMDKRWNDRIDEWRRKQHQYVQGEHEASGVGHDQGQDQGYPLGVFADMTKEPPSSNISMTEGEGAVTPEPQGLSINTSSSQVSVDSSTKSATSSGSKGVSTKNGRRGGMNLDSDSDDDQPMDIDMEEFLPLFATTSQPKPLVNSPAKQQTISKLGGQKKSKSSRMQNDTRPSMASGKTKESSVLKTSPIPSFTASPKPLGEVLSHEGLQALGISISPAPSNSPSRPTTPVSSAAPLTPNKSPKPPSISTLPPPALTPPTLVIPPPPPVATRIDYSIRPPPPLPSPPPPPPVPPRPGRESIGKIDSEMFELLSPPPATASSSGRNHRPSHTRTPSPIALPTGRSQSGGSPLNPFERHLESSSLSSTPNRDRSELSPAGWDEEGRVGSGGARSAHRVAGSTDSGTMRILVDSPLDAPSPGSRSTRTMSPGRTATDGERVPSGGRLVLSPTLPSLAHSRATDSIGSLGTAGRSGWRSTGDKGRGTSMLPSESTDMGLSRAVIDNADQDDVDAQLDKILGVRGAGGAPG